MEVLRFDTLPSTNSFLQENHSSLSDFTFAWASFQSAGKGSHGRSWQAKTNQGLLFSLLLKDQRLVNLPGLPLIAGAIVSSFMEGLGFSPMIKWPNDIYLDNRKAVGILCEGRAGEYVVIGIGINVNQKSFEGEFRAPPTSFSLVAGHDFDIEELAEKLFPYIESCLLQDDISSFALDYVRNRDYLKGKAILLDNEKTPLIAQGIDESFFLRVARDGKIETIASASFTLFPTQIKKG